MTTISTTGNINSTLHELERVLYSPYSQQWEGGLKRGKLDPRKCHRALSGRTDIFRRKDINEAKISAVSITNDLSSSMLSGRKIPALVNLVEGLADICDNNRVDWECVGFSTGISVGNRRAEVRTESVNESDLATENLNRHKDSFDHGEIVTDRLSPNDSQGTRRGYRYHTNDPREGLDYNSAGSMVMFKAFGKRTNPKMSKNLRFFCGHGGTNDSVVYRHAMRRLSEREAGTKIALYLGDGEGDGCEYLADVTREANELGVITLGIGLCTSAVKPWAFNATVQVNDPTNLNADAFRMCIDAVIEKRAELRLKASRQLRG